MSTDDQKQRGDDERPPMRERGAPRAILLDVDGTLIDSNDAHAQSWADTFAEFGLDVPFEKVRPLIGMGGDKLLPTVSGIEKESEQGKRLSERRGEIFRERYLKTLRPFPGARDLLLRLKRDGRTLVVATSAQEKEMRALLKQAGVDDLIEERTSSSDAEHSKPDPDIVEAAVEKSGARPDECVMLGDTPYDVRASRRAGVPVVALRSGGWSVAELTGATEIHDDAAALLADYERSVLSRGAPPGARADARAEAARERSRDDGHAEGGTT